MKVGCPCVIGVYPALGRHSTSPLLFHILFGTRGGVLNVINYQKMIHIFFLCVLTVCNECFWARQRCGTAVCRHCERCGIYLVYKNVLV